jgi:hypothetical protein
VGTREYRGMVHDEMVIQLMVDRSSSNIEAANIAKIDVSLTLVCGMMSWR